MITHRDISVISGEIEDLEIKIGLIEDMPEEFQTEDIWEEHQILLDKLRSLHEEWQSAAKDQLL